MRNIKNHILLFIGLWALFSCQKEIASPDPNLKSFLVITSPYPDWDSVQVNNPIMFVNVGKTASFLDASRGEDFKKRIWFVNGGNILGQDNDQILIREKLLNIKYDVPGEYTVRLVSTFDEEEVIHYERVDRVDTLKDQMGEDSIVVCVQCVLEPFIPDTAIDTTFVIHVLDSIQTAFSMQSATFEAGDSIQFFDATKGTPYHWSWQFEGANIPSSDLQNPKVVWNRSGTYQVTLNASRPQLRGEAEGDEQFISKEITILPSSAALEFLQVETLGDGRALDISFNQVLSELPDKSEFSVEIAGVAQNIASISFPNPSNPFVLRLHLENILPKSSLFNVTSTTNITGGEDGDKILTNAINADLFFEGAGNLFPAGYGNMEGPDGFCCNINGLFIDGEHSSTGGNPWTAYWRAHWPPNAPTIVWAVASTDAFQGNYSMYWTPQRINETAIQMVAKPGVDLPLEPGKEYTCVAWIKAENGAGNISVELRSDVDYLLEIASDVSIQQDEWTRVEGTFTAPNDDLFAIRFVHDNAMANINYFIDEVSVFEMD